MKTRKKIVCLTPLTPEDKALVEALVDGELDDSVRRDLLVRLDRIDGGWKFCAVSFLEAQCLRESFASFSGDWEPFFADSSTTWRADLTASSPLPVGVRPDVDVSDRSSAAPDLSRGLSKPAQISSERSFGTASDKNLFSGNAALRSDGAFDELDFDERNEFDKFDEFLAGDGADFPPPPSSGRREFSEPRIIPIKQGGYRNVYRNATRGGSDGGGPTWRDRLASMAGGFLLAVALGGVLYAQFSTSPKRDANGDDSSALANVETPNASNFSNVGNGARFAQNVVGPETVQKTEPTTLEQGSKSFDVDGAVRVVTLKSPRHQLDGVSVPCFAADRFDATAFRNASADVPPQIAEQLRQTGGRVATSRDEYRFPLEDGRILILPVDTYDVQYESGNAIR